MRVYWFLCVIDGIVIILLETYGEYMGTTIENISGYFGNVQDYELFMRASAGPRLRANTSSVVCPTFRTSLLTLYVFR